LLNKRRKNVVFSIFVLVDEREKLGREFFFNLNGREIQLVMLIVNVTESKQNSYEDTKPRSEQVILVNALAIAKDESLLISAKKTHCKKTIEASLHLEKGRRKEKEKNRNPGSKQLLKMVR
jgi:hypothetical protein